MQGVRHEAVSQTAGSFDISRHIIPGLGVPHEAAGRASGSYGINRHINPVQDVPHEAERKEVLV